MIKPNYCIRSIRGDGAETFDIVISEEQFPVGSRIRVRHYSSARTLTVQVKEYTNIGGVSRVLLQPFRRGTQTIGIEEYWKTEYTLVQETLHEDGTVLADHVALCQMDSIKRNRPKAA